MIMLIAIHLKIESNSLKLCAKLVTNGIVKITLPLLLLLRHKLGQRLGYGDLVRILGGSSSFLVYACLASLLNESNFF